MLTDITEEIDRNDELYSSLTFKGSILDQQEN